MPRPWVNRSGFCYRTATLSLKMQNRRSRLASVKSTMPMRQIPVLDVDGKRAHQSLPIMRYLAKQVGLVGANAWEDLEIDSVVNTIDDFRSKIATVHYEADATIKEAKRGPLEKETFPFFLEKLEAIAKENNGHFALKKLTWADFYFVGVLDYLNAMTKRDLVAGYPNLKKLVDTVLGLESIKKWVAKRPVTEF